MRIPALVSLALFLAACNPASTPAPDGNKIGAKEGEFCGGIAALPCAPGLTCKLEGSYPDAGGKCVKE